MRLSDLIRLAGANLRRNRTRSLLTLVGVLIGVAALLSLVAYGAGTQQVARQEFNTLQLYNTLRVTSTPSPLDALGGMTRPDDQTTWIDTANVVPLTDSLLRVLETIDGVLAAYPEVVFPIEVEAIEGDTLSGQEAIATAEAVPMAFADLPAYQPYAGSFFESAADSAVIMTPAMAARLGFDPPESIVGQPVDLTTVQLDFPALLMAAPMLMRGLGALPLKKEHHTMRVAGLTRQEGQVMSGLVRVIMPLGVATQLNKITFFSTLDLMLSGAQGTDGYAAARVQLSDEDALVSVRAAIEEQGVFVVSLRDQFQQVERLFLLMDLALGIVGFIALLVATIGIANTMMMNVMERTHEIGVMKAIGGDEGDLQRLFVAESVALGTVGGFLGLVIGWLLTEVMNWGINIYLGRLGVPYIDVFYISFTMLVSILAIALAVSLLAGFAPARRASRIEPVEALRA
ncbi:MAG: FtsX-like permease family protein [Bacteroidota bacterium]